MDETERMDTGGMERRADADRDDAAEQLANAFYRGLGAGIAGVTAAIQRRDLAIARQLVAAGATAAQAEAYAQETSAANGRIAPVDMRSFERERLGWLARRRGADVNRRHLVDRTGQAPSWEARSDSAPPPGATLPLHEPAPVTSRPGDPAIAANEDLGAKLRGLLLRGDQQS